VIRGLLEVAGLTLIENSLDLDFIYYRALHLYIAGEVELDKELRAKMTTFAQRRIEQLTEYKRRGRSTMPSLLRVESKLVDFLSVGLCLESI
jgi:hypothetical protein